ncbi:FecR family protein [Reyranella sp.]|uniref:FecR family protein n=1 Tax=Reyranella sp. TaxID=1929291 RepID=UPI003BA8D73E
MTVPPTRQQADHDRERIDDEAADWFLLLSDEPDDPMLRARLEAWCGRSPLHREVWERTRQAYRLIGEAPPRHAADWRPSPEPSATAAAVVAAGRWPYGRRLVAGGVALALFAWLAVAVAPGMLLRLQADQVTATAERRTLDLQDGSRVVMAPESALDVAYAEDGRTVRLLAGQAFFEVTPDVRRPFRVLAGGIAITVLGTAFDVRLEEGGGSVAVRHGLVRVDVTGREPPVSRRLAAGQSIRVAASGAIRPESVEPDDVGRWTRGLIVARDKSIAEIVDMLRPYYDGAIVVRDDAFAGLRVSGIYDLGDPVATLRNLASLHGAVLRQVSPWLVVVTAR